MTQDEMMKFAIAGAILFAGFKFGNGVIKAGSLAIAATVIAKQIPYLNQVV